MERFPSDVAAVLREAGWSEGRQVRDVATETIRELSERHAPFPAADQALTEFGALYVDQDGPGVTLRRRPFAIDPTMTPPSAVTLAAFGRALGVALFPLGVEGDDDAILAIDEHGRVFSLDEGGEWFLGEDVPAALTTLVNGELPPRVNDDGTW